MTLANFADWVTIAGFLATIWVLWITTNLRKSFLNRARIPEIRGDLEKFSSNLLKAIQAGNSDELDSSCSRIRAALEAAVSKTTKATKSRILALINKIEMTRENRLFDIESIKPIYSELVGINEILKNIEKDASWRP